MSRRNRVIVVALAGVLFLAVTGVPFYHGGAIVSGQDAKLHADFQALGIALTEYENISGAFPAEAQGLSALVVKPTASPVPTRWYQMMQSVPKDPWGQPYVYRIPSRHGHQPYDLFSTGKDKVESADDIDSRAGEK